jgi:hypothetical protein
VAQAVESGETMRFMLCSRDRSSGALKLVLEDSFESRREAVEAISGVRDFSEYAGADIFLVDLNGAVPVAVVPWRPETADGVVALAASDPAVAASGEEPCEEAGPGDAVRLGVVEIDIEAWTCEDCIYISTCAKAGTIRPADCGAFQWRA